MEKGIKRMNKLCAGGVLMMLCGHLFAQQPGQDARQAIVKIYTTFALPSYYTPWNIGGPATRTGSGCIISGKRILTNAHVVGDETFIQVRRYGDAGKYRARVLFVSHAADLALLSVDNESFFDGIEPLELDGLPETQAEVMVLGFPTGGDMLSSTKGVISRIEHQNYAHSSFSFLAGQIDAAINPGNSGGPVMEDGKVVGVVMQHLSAADNIGYMVPAPLVDHFLTDVEDGRYDGLPNMGIRTGNMENPDARRKYGLPEDKTGIAVLHISLGSPAEGVLKPGDILLEVDGYPVADDRTIEFRPDERTLYSYLAEMRQVGESLPLKIFRDGQEMDVNVVFTQSGEGQLLVPMEQYGRRPSYYIFGGAVFCPLTKNYLSAWGSNWYQTAPKPLVFYYNNRDLQESGEEVVVLIRVLADDVNKGYHGYSSWAVDFLNGRKIKNLQGMVRQIEAADESEFMVFSDSLGNEMVLNKKNAMAALPAILERYRIPADRSDDLN